MPRRVTTTRRRCCARPAVRSTGDGPDLDDNRYPVRLSDHHPPRDPCTITGTITVDGRSYEIEAAVGQRDHSRRARLVEHGLGVGALHLDDDTHLHGSTYPRPAAARVSATSSARGRGRDDRGVRGCDVRGQRLARADRIVHQPGPVDTTIRVVGNAPVRLVAPDGRVSCSRGPGSRWRPPTAPRCRVGGVEPQPLTTGAPSRRPTRRSAGPSVWLPAGRRHHHQAGQRVSANEQAPDLRHRPDPRPSAVSQRIGAGFLMRSFAAWPESVRVPAAVSNPRAAVPRHRRPLRRCSRGCADELRRHRAGSGVQHVRLPAGQAFDSSAAT